MLLFEHLSIDEIDPALSSSRTVQILRTMSLTDGISTDLVQYAPTVAPRRAATISGGGGYADVEDTIVVDIVGDTPGNCGATLMRLIGYIIQGGRWFAGENVNPVQVRARVERSTFTSDWMALILGPAGEQPPVAIDPQFDTTIDRWVIRGVELRFLRRGRWLASNQFYAANAAGATRNPQVLSFGSLSGTGGNLLGVDAPIALVPITTIGGTIGGEIGYLLSAVSAAAILLTDASTATAAGYTTVANAAAFPFQGTNILRYTPTTTNFAASGLIYSNQITSAYQTWAVYAAVRKNTAAASFQVRVAVTPESTGGIQGPVIRTRPVVVDSTDVDPQILPVGVFAVNAQRFDLQLEIAASTTTGPPTFDISYLVLHALDAPGARAIQINPGGAATIGRAVVSADAYNLRVGEARPVATSGIETFGVATTFFGDTDFVLPAVSDAGSTPTLSAVYLETDGTFWTVANGGANRVIEIAMLARAASLFPR